MPDKDAIHDVALNRQAHYEYEIVDSLEAGIVLTGTEIKSIRAGKVNLRGAYARVRNGELWLEGMHIAPYAEGTYMNHEPMRLRKLLVHRRQLHNLMNQIQVKGMTLIPLKMYFKGSLAKIQLGVGRGKKLYDKREDIAKREIARDIARAERRG